MSQWKIISQKPVFKAELFDVRKIVFKNDEGKEKIHHVAYRKPFVTIFPLTNKYEVYLISQYRNMLNCMVLEAVSGYIEGKESAITAAKRELKEEVGIEAYQLEEMTRVEMTGSAFRTKGYLFLVKELELGEANPDEDEEISIVKMSLEEAVGKVMSGEINHAASMLGILMLDKLRSEKKL